MLLQSRLLGHVLLAAKDRAAIGAAVPDLVSKVHPWFPDYGATTQPVAVDRPLQVQDNAAQAVQTRRT